MGYLLASQCTICDFSNKFSYGGGKFNYTTNCPVPAINKETLEFENVNYLDLDIRDKYLFYSDDILKGDNQDRNTLMCFDLELNTINNYCPKCRQKALNFYIAMFGD